ncbi:MAG: hypothetical protein E6K18_05955 [Methanobacteriota archaeon]|nr:MAG: hypothetical protein E6K18_05955 [Euryarchaeota archaeon]
MQCPASPGARQIAFFDDITPGTPTDWLIEIYSSGDATQEGFRAQFAGSDIAEYLLIEFEMVDNAAWSMFMFTLDPVGGTLDGFSLCGTTCPSDDPIYGSLAVQNDYVVFGGALHNPSFFGTANHVMQVMDSLGGGGGANWNFINGGTGVFEPPTGEQKYLALAGTNDVIHAAYRSGTDLVYWFSVNGGDAYQGPFRASSNAVGTVAHAPHSIDVTYGAKVGIAFIDTRNANNDPFYATLSGYSMYIIKKNPASIGGTINIDTIATPVPAGFIWAVGPPMHNVDAPQTEPGPPDTQYNFQSWSDAGARVHDITPGAADTILVANYGTQYFLTMSSPVGTVLPGSSWQDKGATVAISWTGPAPGPCARSTFSRWVGQGPGSFSGPSASATIVMNGPITELAQASQQFCFNFYTNPSGLQLTINGTTFATPKTGLWWDDGSTNTATAISPQSPGGPLTRFSFTQWDDGTTTAARTIRVTSTTASNYTAIYRLEDSVQIRPTPADCQYVVDGTTYSAGQTFWFQDGSQHAIDSPSPQVKAPDTRYVFSRWSDNGAQSHIITVTGALTLDLTCTVEYRFQFDTTPPGGNLLLDGTPLPAPQTVWWAAGTTHTAEFPLVQITPDSRRVLQQWSDANTANPRSFTNIAAGATLVAQTVLQYRYILDTSPTGLSLTVDGSPMTAPVTLWWNDGSSHTAQFITVSQPDTQLVFTQWSDANPSNPRTFNVAGPGTFTAQVVAQYRFILDTQPTGLTLTVDTLPCTAPCTLWWTHGTSHTAQFQTVQINADSRQSFARWSDNDVTNPRSFNAQNPMTLTVITQLEYRYQLDTSPTALALLVDNNPCTALCIQWFVQGSTHTVSFNSPQAGPTDTQYVFNQWSDGSAVNPRTLSGVSGPVSLTAQTYTEYRIRFDTSPTGIVVTVGGTAVATPGSAWVRASTPTAINVTTQAASATAGKRYVFTQWADGSPNAVRTISVTAPGSFTANFKTQYQVTFSGLPTSVTGSCTPATDCWFDSGTSATVALSADTVAVSSGERQKFVQWTGATGTSYSASNPTTMSAPLSVGAQWKTQYLVTIATDPAGGTFTLTVGGTSVTYDTNGIWVDKGSTLAATVPTDATISGSSYKFVNWADGQAAATDSVTINAKTDLVAKYRTVSITESPALWIGLIGAIIAAILIAFFLMRRRKQEPEEAPAAAGGSAAATAPPPPGEEGPTMECPSCGMTIPAVSGACPICGSEVVAPAAPAAPEGDERITRLNEAYRSGRISKEQYQANMRRLRGNA